MYHNHMIIPILLIPIIRIGCARSSLSNDKTLILVRDDYRKISVFVQSVYRQFCVLKCLAQFVDVAVAVEGGVGQGGAKEERLVTGKGFRE